MLLNSSTSLNSVPGRGSPSPRRSWWACGGSWCSWSTRGSDRWGPAAASAGKTWRPPGIPCRKIWKKGWKRIDIVHPQEGIFLELVYIHPICKAHGFAIQSLLIGMLHSIPVIWSSDIWSFRIFGQYLGGPNFPEYTKFDHISRIWPEFRLYGQFLAGPTVDHISGTECISKAVCVLELKSLKPMPIALKYCWTKSFHVRSGIRTHAHRSGLRPERSALDRSAILTSYNIRSLFLVV